MTSASRPGSAAAICGHLGPPVEALAAVGVAVHRDQHLRGGLGEPVDHAVRAEVRRAGRPDGAQARAGQQADEGLRGVRQVARDAVAAADAEGPQAGPDPAPPAAASSP